MEEVFKWENGIFLLEIVKLEEKIDLQGEDDEFYRRQMLFLFIE